NKFNARNRRHLEDIDRHDLAVGADALRRHLAPAARCGAQIDHTRAAFEQAMLVVDLDQLEGRARTETFALGARDIRIVELTLQPELGRQRAALAGFYPRLHGALASPPPPQTPSS